MEEFHSLKHHNIGDLLKLPWEPESVENLQKRLQYADITFITMWKSETTG